MRVLLAEDDKRLGRLIEYMLTQNRVQVEWITNGADIYEYAMYSEYDILILDWMMPNVSGIDACRALRDAGYEKAILMLTAKDTIEDRVTGLDAGADDYLVKPFEFEELLARLRALGRRSSQKIQQEIVEVGEFTLNRTTKVLKKKNQVIQLSPREFQHFDLLSQNLGVVVPREIILDRIWGLERDI
ncbi:MAG: response regulator transcription factor, partial [Selenomonadaceae bacterium]|nr:response regulator transcription factor [Selenomonadaceae bacterium]